MAFPFGFRRRTGSDPQPEAQVAIAGQRQHRGTHRRPVGRGDHRAAGGNHLGDLGAWISGRHDRAPA